MKKLSLNQVPYLILVGVMLWMILAITSNLLAFSKSSDAERAVSIEQAIRKAAVQCYSVEGSYPPNIDWLEDHYGLVIDHDQYVIVYEAFASNLMPEIEVQPR